MKFIFLPVSLAGFAALAAQQPALAADVSATVSDTTDAATGGGADSGQSRRDIVVTAKRLDEARASIQPKLGATSYTIDNATIQALPGGDNQQFNQIILQLPGVVQDGFGQFHVRDDHNNLQYRINGTILPEGLAVFGQTLSPRLIDHFSLLTGALPAQYGLRTAGIIDVTTKSGLFHDGGSVSLYGGSHGTIEPSIEYGGSTGSTNYFFSGDYRRDKLGIESVDGSSTPIHDRTKQLQLFGYVDHILDENDRISFVGGYSNQNFQIPDPSGLHAAQDGPGYEVGGQTDYLSDDLDERQNERTGFGQFSFLHDSGPLSLQASLYGRYSALDYKPDVLGELLFNGLAQHAVKKDVTFGGQVDAAYRLGSAHTIRAGVVISRDRGTSHTTTQVFPLDTDGNQAGQPIAIVDNGAKTEWTYSAYLQDEWKILPHLTLNIGGRFDAYDGYRSEHQFSPRANLSWQPTPTTTIHAGYARYFSPAPFELVATTSVAKFSGTSAAAPTTLDTTPFAERQNYFDLGFQQKIGSAFSFGVDGYYRRSHNLIDEGQFGAPIILTPFNYRRGRIKGVEVNGSYSEGPWMIYGNFAYAKAQGKDIVSSQFSFDPDDLAYIRVHYIYLDHDQTYTASAGITYKFRNGALQGLGLGGTMIYGSGLRTDGSVPNGAKLDPYAQFNLSATYRLAGPGIELRADVINVADHVYEIRDGGGVGVGAPEYGPRRGFFFGISKDL
ncbi:TonB-dependent receptor [Flavisphingomonas formosensis]|uniref:TonB-dependent receptor n=1 Tax=Flavisphingomonas formosensis TaxID=861534 RepID=UPI0018E0628A|nr:TonB-dependent receptor [Sphingomonas formosensis]